MMGVFERGNWERGGAISEVDIYVDRDWQRLYIERQRQRGRKRGRIKDRLKKTTTDKSECIGR